MGEKAKGTLARRSAAGSRPRLARSASLATAALACVFAFPAAPASAGVYHPKPAACSFGKDGTSATSFANGKKAAFDQVARRLYATRSTDESGVYGFDATAVCTGGESGGYAPLAGFEPLSTPELNINNTDIAVDDSVLSSQGNIYLSGGTPLLGYGSAGNKLFEILAEEILAEGDHDWTAVAVDPGGNLWAVDRQLVLYELGPGGNRSGRPARSLRVSRPRGGTRQLARLRRRRQPLPRQQQRRLAAGGAGL